MNLPKDPKYPSRSLFAQPIAEVVHKNWFSRKKIQAPIDLAASFDISDLEKFQTDFFQTYIKSRHLLQ